MDKECKHCGSPYLPVGGKDDLIIEAPYCECDMEKQLEIIKNPSAKVYKNHCWNCKSEIDSRICKRDPERENGYICKRCGHSLRNFKNRI